MGGGAWPCLVGGVVCLVNSVNERDPRLLNSVGNAYALPFPLCTLFQFVMGVMTRMLGKPLFAHVFLNMYKNL